MSNLVDFAKEELRRLRAPGSEPDTMQDAIEACVIGIVETFAEQGHSGSSAPYVIGILEKVLRFEPVTPLTGNDDEWCEIGFVPDMKWQNKRCPHVFKRADGTAYDIEAFIFRDPDGAYFTSRDSRKDITFPYVPKREYVDRPAS